MDSSSRARTSLRRLAGDPSGAQVGVALIVTLVVMLGALWLLDRASVPLSLGVLLAVIVAAGVVLVALARLLAKRRN